MSASFEKKVVLSLRIEIYCVCFSKQACVSFSSHLQSFLLQLLHWPCSSCHCQMFLPEVDAFPLFIGEANNKSTLNTESLDVGNFGISSLCVCVRREMLVRITTYWSLYTFYIHKITHTIYLNNLEAICEEEAGVKTNSQANLHDKTTCFYKVCSPAAFFPKCLNIELNIFYLQRFVKPHKHAAAAAAVVALRTENLISYFPQPRTTAEIKSEVSCYSRVPLSAHKATEAAATTTTATTTPTVGVPYQRGDLEELLWTAPQHLWWILIILLSIQSGPVEETLEGVGDI